MTIHWSQNAYRLLDLVYGLVFLNKYNLKFYAGYNRVKVWGNLITREFEYYRTMLFIMASYYNILLRFYAYT